jgi:rod shape-determining protein MreC
MKKFFSHPFVLSLAIIIGLIFFNQQGWLKTPQNIFFKSTSALQASLYQFSLKMNDFVDFIFSLRRLNSENNNLKEENQKLLGELARLKAVNQENQLLRQQVGLPLSEESQLIMADIIGKDLSNLGNYFLINKGIEDGIREKMVVIAAGNLLVGRINEVFDSFAKVELVTSPNSRVNARLYEPSATGLVKGDRKLSLIFDLLPQQEPIQEGGLVVTSGLAGLFPAGLAIGQIERVVSFDVSISQIAEVKPAVDFNNLERVFVIIPK